MIVQMRKGILVLQPVGAAAGDVDEWASAHDGQIFRMRRGNEGALRFHAIGPEDEVCRVPINITSRAPGTLKMISNFAEARFVLDGAEYARVEGFWQGLKFPDEPDRRRLAALHGSAARDAGYYAPKSDVITYAKQTVRVGTWDHWQLMERACSAKFEQCDAARTALISTGKRPLMHQMRRDSRNIPGVIMADIWMRIRTRMQNVHRSP
jgi:predicted NAD-dependent protein-ADP-ribosyltransferase YbiA (DUF1768 family)